MAEDPLNHNLLLQQQIENLYEDDLVEEVFKSDGIEKNKTKIAPCMVIFVSISLCSRVGQTSFGKQPST